MDQTQIGVLFGQHDQYLDGLWSNKLATNYMVIESRIGDWGTIITMDFAIEFSRSAANVELVRHASARRSFTYLR